MLIPSPNTTAISDHTLGASLAFLGFPCSWAATVHERTRKKHLQFFFEPLSVRFPSLPDLDTLLKQWRGGQLTDPHHLLNVCTRAQANYDAMIKWQKEGVTQVLQSLSEGRAYYYHSGQLPVFSQAGCRDVDHLQLAAALAEIGFQVITISGPDRHHSYRLPALGLAMLDSHGHSLRYDLATVTRLAPTREDAHQLALEISQPMHPLVIAYNALRCRAVIKKQIDREHANLLIEDGGRQALIGMNASGHVMDHVTAHFKAPPLP